MSKTICLAFTGASGMPYGVRLLECLLTAGHHVQLLYSAVAQIVAQQELDLALPGRPGDAADHAVYLLLGVVLDLLLRRPRPCKYLVKLRQLLGCYFVLCH